MKYRIVCMFMCLVLLVMASACGGPSTSLPVQTSDVTESVQSTRTAVTEETTVQETAGNSAEAMDLTYFFVDNPGNIVYIKTDITAVVVDADVTNTIPIERAGEAAVLPAGSVLYPAHLKPGVTISFAADMDFITYQGVEIHINTAVSADGTILFDGKSITDLFGGAFESIDENAANYQEAQEVDEIVMKPWEALDPHAFYKKIIIRMDWNQDGVEDEFFQSNEDDLSNTFTFTDGKTGEVTDLYALGLVPENDNTDTEHDDTIGLKLDSTSLVVQNSKGEYGILSSIYYDDSGFVSYAFWYEPDTLIACKGIGEAFSYQEGQLYYHPYTNCLGNLWLMNQTVDLADDFTFANYSQTQFYSPYYKISLSAGHTIFSKTTVTIDISNGSGYEASTLAPGTVILPNRLEKDKNGTTYLYVALADGREGRFTYTAGENDYPVYLNGVDQWELFEGINVGG